MYCTSPILLSGTTSDTNNQQQSTLGSKAPNNYSQQNVSLTHPLLPHQQQNQGQGGEERQLPAPSSPTNQSPHVVIQGFFFLYHFTAFRWEGGCFANLFAFLIRYKSFVLWLLYWSNFEFFLFLTYF